MYLFSELNFFSLILLLALWALGGWLIVARIFDLHAHERGVIGLSIGLTIATLLANLLARFVPATFAFWGAALLTVVIGVALARPFKRELFAREAFQPLQWVILILAVFVFTLIGRGLGFFDDQQNLPQLSSMALGDVPPHFALDPRQLWSYHYFLLLVAAQFERLTDAPPWVAIDLARGLSLGLTISLGGLLAYRLTTSRVAASLSMAFLFFAGGARWILFILPARLLQAASSGIALIGSGADTGPNLTTALYKYWQIQGLGPLPFPFVYGSGLDASMVMAHAGYGTSMVMLALLLVLLAGRGRGWIAQAIFALTLAALALANEVTFAFLYAGLIFAILFWAVKNRNLRPPQSLWAHAPALIAGGLLVLVQGGILTGIFTGWIGRLTGAETNVLYQTSFKLQMPVILSAHLGSLSLLNLTDWFVILAETGLVVLALPWVFKYSLKLVSDEKWLEAAWLFSIIPSLLTVFLEYTGNAGPTALSRMTAHFLLVLKIYAVPLLWLWVQGRSETLKTALLGWGLATCLSGLALFSLQIAAMPNPVYAEFLGNLDARMYARHWGKLQSDAFVFDDNPPRATTVLGLHTISSTDFNSPNGPPSDPTFLALAGDPDPYRLNAAGYRYAYLDLRYWRKYGARFEQTCVRSLDKFEETGADGKLSDLRWLLDLKDCH
jgi:hypothetical protein